MDVLLPCYVNPLNLSNITGLVASFQFSCPTECTSERRDFSPDELNQFFVTPQSSVELPHTVEQFYVAHRLWINYLMDKNIRELVSMKSSNPVTLCREPPTTVFQAR
ncbi:hypothetical protein P7K49_036060 [Saguinus oedipus]|uniref:Uncharacterized protein n=1 Tax=Saguinus oedipus TaxID=9490 RepID=A0ABQ9TQ61_SAGOE|nr:hypothetical protein P7K49_036060 [Saguinus oedipus]